MVSELSVLVTLVEAFNLHPYMAGVAGKETAILVMFALNDRFTFATEGTNRVPALLKRLVRSHGVRFVGIAIAYAIFVALIHWGDVWYLLADVVGIAAGVMVNYILENVFTWRTL